MKKTREEQAAQIRHEETYSVELARGGSHIASTRSLPSLQAAVAEVLEDFVARYGVANSTAFLNLLANRLDNRRFPDAAKMVRLVAAVGVARAFNEATDESQRSKAKTPIRRPVSKIK